MGKLAGDGDLTILRMVVTNMKINCSGILNDSGILKKIREQGGYFRKKKNTLTDQTREASKGD